MVRSATSVTADLANGQHIAGTVRLSAGFPFAEWWVDYPKYPWSVSTVFVFRDAAGHVVTRLSLKFRPRINPLAHPTQLTPADVGNCSYNGWNSQLVRVRQTMDGIKTWTYIQFARDPQNGPSFCEHAGLLNGSTGFETSFRAFPTLTPDRPVLAQCRLACGHHHAAISPHQGHNPWSRKRSWKLCVRMKRFLSIRKKVSKIIA